MTRVTNSSVFNLNKNLRIPHHSVLVRTGKSPQVKHKYPTTVKHLAKIAKTSPNKAFGKTAPEGVAEPMPLHLLVITNTTSDAEEQYALLTVYWKCLGLKKANAHNYRKISPAEADYIRRAYIAGNSIYSIAKALNRSPSTIYYFLKRNNLI